MILISLKIPTSTVLNVMKIITDSLRITQVPPTTTTETITLTAQDDVSVQVPQLKSFLTLGMHLGERNMWRIMAKIIWGFNIEPEIDPSTGKPFPIDVDAYNSGILQAPLPFRAKITPRSQAHIDTIRREWREYKDNLTPFE
jgi:hypothetical protein